MTEAYLNGDFLSAEQVNASVFDKGFLLGDGVYEIIPVCKGHCFKLADRLQARLSGLQMTNVLWRALVKQLIERIGGGSLALH
jgi:D-alanine transaminase